MDDPGRLSTQYDRAYLAAAFIDRAVEQLHGVPVGLVQDDGEQVGRYLATVAALVDPSLAGELDVELVTEIPHAMVAQLGVLSRRDPSLSKRLLETGRAIQTGQVLDGEQIRLVEGVASVATRDALVRSRQIVS
jgi:hypothetical protein